MLPQPKPRFSVISTSEQFYSNKMACPFYEDLQFFLTSPQNEVEEIDPALLGPMRKALLAYFS